MFASFSIDYAFRSFLTEACKRPAEKMVPIIHVLLDNGADVHDGFGPGGGALYAALLGSPLREIIERIVENGGYISWRVLSTAIGEERLDVLQSLLRQSQVWKSDELESFVKTEKDTGNEEVIAVV